MYLTTYPEGTSALDPGASWEYDLTLWGAVVSALSVETWKVKHHHGTPSMYIQTYEVKATEAPSNVVASTTEGSAQGWILHIVKQQSSLYQRRPFTQIASYTPKPLPIQDEDWLPLGGTEWIQYLDVEDRRKMLSELRALLITALLSGRWNEYFEALYAWRSTSEVLSDPELTADLLAESDPSQEVPLLRP